MRPRVLVSVLFACALWPTGAFCAGNEEWTSLGPEGGGFRFLVIDPQKAREMYAVSDSGRPFKSMDSGTSWKALRSLEFGVTVLAINPQRSSTLYAGTAGSRRVFAGSSGGGVFTITFDADTVPLGTSGDHAGH